MGIPLKDQKDEFEILIIRKALLQCGGNQARAAKLLGMDRTTLIRLVNKAMERENNQIEAEPRYIQREEALQASLRCGLLDHWETSQRQRKLMREGHV